MDGVGTSEDAGVMAKHEGSVGDAEIAKHLGHQIGIEMTGYADVHVEMHMGRGGRRHCW